MGKRVIALTSTDAKAAFARTQGAYLAVVEGRSDSIPIIREGTGGRGVDLILDAVAGSRFPTLFDHAAPLGLVVLYGYLTGWPDSASVFDAIRAHFDSSPALRLFSMHTFDADPAMRRVCTDALLDLFASGVLRPVIHERVPLAEAARAHEMLEGGKVLGKLVLKP
jgi:NADPH2:quinone reductase